MSCQKAETFRYQGPETKLFAKVSHFADAAINNRHSQIQSLSLQRLLNFARQKIHDQEAQEEIKATKRTAKKHRKVHQKRGI